MTQSITHHLEAWRHGDGDAADRVLPLLYNELRRVARRTLSRAPYGSTLQATALVHEAYLRCCERDLGRWHSRRHFLATAAQMMRQILVDSARRRGSRKRGGDHRILALEEAADLVAGGRAPEILALDGALDALAEIDRRKARIVELRFFGGLTLSEVAQDLGISTATTHREWRRARAWLYCALATDEG